MKTPPLIKILALLLVIGIICLVVDYVKTDGNKYEPKIEDVEIIELNDTIMGKLELNNDTAIAEEYAEENEETLYYPGEGYDEIGDEPTEEDEERIRQEFEENM